MVRPLMSDLCYLSIKIVDDGMSKKRMIEGRRVSEMTDEEWMLLKQQTNWLAMRHSNPTPSAKTYPVLSCFTV